ncbi:MAG: hypothetical protein HYY23_00365 [Verrucomicrobia bacterium]|nr:hypothetical protein [Verrucomicrobiota bacterium]
MLRFFVGLAIPLVGTVLGVTMAGGRVTSFLHLSEMITVLGFIVGGTIMAFGISETHKMLWSALDLSKDRSPERLRRNILVCEGASKFSLYGGFIACFLGVVITMGNLAGDVSRAGEQLGAAMTGLILGAGITGVVFQPLKFRFLGLLSESEDSISENAKRPHEEALS